MQRQEDFTHGRPQLVVIGYMEASALSGISMVLYCRQRYCRVGESVPLDDRKLLLAEPSERCFGVRDSNNMTVYETFGENNVVNVVESLVDP